MVVETQRKNRSEAIYLIFYIIKKLFKKCVDK